ncbi:MULTISPECIES: hypothetical protein [Providencia]|uniref:hypothetical protein n=1 Tax=Providencia TaxID=586 RepID=UPI0015ECB1E9|nr:MULTISPECIES: hypothetical protein [Providencia]ELR5139199.1 hypothetical protein [Providencia rettgeri]QLQ93626.1 hypothetical protein H0907_20670 [Providencia rettgeri]WEB84243.1 hypothetical protein LVJ10_20690 [Providencia rettgeri]HCH7934622.1 hypothetical protein [Providencia rettgeri]
MNFTLKIGCILLPFISMPIMAGEWYASYHEDEMRGTARKILTLSSQNKHEFSFPYAGGTSMTLVLRSAKTTLKKEQKPSDLKVSEAIVYIDKGQFICQAYDQCYVSVKFDNNPVEKYSVLKPQDHSSDSLLIKNSKKFIEQVTDSQKVIIEANFYHESNKQFKFDLTNMDKAKVSD